MTPSDVAQLLAQGELQLVDVRTVGEREVGRIAGSRHVELSELAAAAQTIDRERPVVFYCRIGARSAMATEAFRGAGYDARNMTGGLLAWEAAGLPIDPPGGSVAAA